MRFWNRATLLLQVPGRRWERVIARLIIYGLVPPIRLRLISWPTEAEWLLSLCTRFGPWNGRLRLCISWTLLFIIFGIVAVSGWRDDDKKSKTHTFTMTSQALFHHAIEDCARLDKALIHRDQVSCEERGNQSTLKEVTTRWTYHASGCTYRSI
jgi:hypothetical protein